MIGDLLDLGLLYGYVRGRTLVPSALELGQRAPLLLAGLSHVLRRSGPCEPERFSSRRLDGGVFGCGPRTKATRRQTLGSVVHYRPVHPRVRAVIVCCAVLSARVPVGSCLGSSSLLLRLCGCHSYLGGGDLLLDPMFFLFPWRGGRQNELMIVPRRWRESMDGGRLVVGFEGGDLSTIQTGGYTTCTMGLP